MNSTVANLLVVYCRHHGISHSDDLTPKELADAHKCDLSAFDTVILSAFLDRPNDGGFVASLLAHRTKDDSYFYVWIFVPRTQILDAGAVEQAIVKALIEIQTYSDCACSVSSSCAFHGKAEQEMLRDAKTRA